MSKKEYKILDDELIDHIAGLSSKDQNDWLFLIPHARFAGRWYVDSLNQGFIFDFEEIIQKYRTVSPATLEEFFRLADKLGYHVAFSEEPYAILDAYEHLNDVPEFSLNSDIEGTIAGMLPFQLQGFNFLRRDDTKGGLALWSTGTGKTALEAALIKQHVEIEKAFDLVLVVVKPNNKVDTQRKLKTLGDIQSVIVDGKAEKRAEIYSLIREAIDIEPVVVILNYEKLKDDFDRIRDLIEDRRVLIFFDEMPTKLRNRDTQLYQSVAKILYKSAPKIKWASKRPAHLRTYQLTATPIENSPEDQLNCIRLQDPDVFPSISKWENKFVVSRNRFSKKPETFRGLDEMGLMVDFMTHQVDKNDPDIAAMFPDIIEEPIYIDWSEQDRMVYEKLQSIALDMAKKAKEAEDNGEIGKRINPLQLIGVLQMLCDAPSMVQKSAENREIFDAMLYDYEDGEAEYPSNLKTGSEAALILLDSLPGPLTDKHSEKLKKLHEILTEKHPNEKCIVFSALADYIFPIFEKSLTDWGIKYVVFKGTDKQRQAALDKFRNDDSIRVFISSDAGSDSIDLAEASVVIHFDLPWKWATLIQRQNRAHRINSEHGTVYFYTFLMPNSVEDRKVEIISMKLGFHQGIYKGQISEDAISSRMSSADLHYILTGERGDDTL